MRLCLLLCLLCLASLPASFTVKGRTAIPLSAPAHCLWWHDQIPQSSSHIHQPWVKLRPGCYIGSLNLFAESVLPLCPFCQSSLRARECILKTRGAVVPAVVSGGSAPRAGSAALHQEAEQTPASSLGKLHTCTEYARARQCTRDRQ